MCVNWILAKFATMSWAEKLRLYNQKHFAIKGEGEYWEREGLMRSTFNLSGTVFIWIQVEKKSDEHLFRDEFTKLGGKPEDHLYAAIPRFYSKVSEYRKCMYSEGHVILMWHLASKWWTSSSAETSWRCKVCFTFLHYHPQVTFLHYNKSSSSHRFKNIFS